MDNILNAVTASCIAKAAHSSSSIHSISINNLQGLLHTSFNTAKSVYVSLLKLRFARLEGVGTDKNMIFSSLQRKDNNGYVYVYAHVDHNGVHLYNYTGGYPVFENRPQTFKEAKNVILELAMCTKIALYNQSADSEEVCNGEDHEEVSLFDMAQREGIYWKFYAGWSEFFINKGYNPDIKWNISTKTKDDKVKNEEQKNTRPIALTFIEKSFFNKTQSLSTIKRLMKQAIDNGLLKKYDNGRILIYYEDTDTFTKHHDPKTSYLFDKEGKPTKLFFRINKREMKINGDLKKARSTQPKVTDAWKQPGMNSYAVKAVGVLDGLAKHSKSATFFLC